jgi:hypothetical protein
VPHICCIEPFSKVQRLLNQYLLCDSLLLFQIYYYRWKNTLCRSGHHTRNRTHRRYPTARKHSRTQTYEPLEHGERGSQILAMPHIHLRCRYRGMGDRHENPRTQAAKRTRSVVEWRSQILGWVSAALFCTSSTVSLILRFVPLTPDTAAVLLQWAPVYHKSVSDSSLRRNPLPMHTFHSEEF